MRKFIFITPGSSALEIGLGSLGFSGVFADFYKDSQKPADLTPDTSLKKSQIFWMTKVVSKKSLNR